MTLRILANCVLAKRFKCRVEIKLDWKIKNPESLYKHAVAEVEREGKGIILFHDIQPQTIEMMPKFLKYLKYNGYQPVVFNAEKIRGIDWH